MAGCRDGPWGVAAEALDAAKLPKARQLSESFAASLEPFFEQFSDGKAVSKASAWDLRYIIVPAASVWKTCNLK